ncbi:MAG: hypothetical protein HOE30_06785 [Deltaproteobacteria bacterium]|jgi:hypothetical protein|nr:hypothetical protein [Deltaproteobacteria bacterium]MBT4267656.1 hypothetical protein [Deltaproteobacteria bacterium]MBT6502220.1 hypothetical protein [Deltaproteobacteria bacterium]MBT7155253.1 hypothetical protein [Deltaproteobacteria bacterium]MBT7715331.1 hypothetical protein [Deltaproteobacteria bacterium]
MNYIKLFLISIGMVLTFQNSWAEEVRVNLEPLPPLVVDIETGLTLQLLREIEGISDLKFTITIGPYNRAKMALKDGRAALMGHTPHQLEAKEFYEYAQELKWSIPTKIDVYSLKKDNVSLGKYKTLKRIGTPRGNKEFISEVLGIPLNQFYEGKIENLFKMLAKGRIDAFLFERVSSQTSIKKLKLQGVYYHEVMFVPASFAVQKTPQGTRLMKKLDALINKTNHTDIFKDYSKFMKLPKEGVVSLSN